MITSKRYRKTFLNKVIGYLANPRTYFAAEAKLSYGSYGLSTNLMQEMCGKIVYFL